VLSPPAATPHSQAEGADPLSPRNFRRKQKKLLTQQPASDRDGSLAPSPSLLPGGRPAARAGSPPQAVATTTTTLVDVPSRGGSMEEEQAAGKLGSASNIMPTGRLYQPNNLSRNRALVLDSAYRPINVITWAKAVMMDLLDKAEVVEYYPPPAMALSGQGHHDLPAVMRVRTVIDLNDLCSRVTCTRRNIMVRDKYTCQYCGCKGRDLTLDHVMPASKGGKDTWTNLVTACMACNQRKGDKLLSTIGWRLRNTPREPTPWEIGVVVGLSSGDIERPPAEWMPYLAPYRAKIEAIKKLAQDAGMEDSDSDSE